MLVESQIREALKLLIEPLEGMRDHVVFDTTAVPKDSDRHWVVVTVGDEIIEQQTLGNPTVGSKQLHTIDTFIDVMHADRIEPLQKAEALLERIIPAVFRDRTLGRLVLRITAVAKRRDKDLGGAPIARLRLQCQTVYQTYDRDPSTSV